MSEVKTGQIVKKQDEHFLVMGFINLVGKQHAHLMNYDPIKNQISRSGGRCILLNQLEIVAERQPPLTREQLDEHVAKWIRNN